VLLNKAADTTITRPPLDSFTCVDLVDIRCVLPPLLNYYIV